MTRIGRRRPTYPLLLILGALFASAASARAQEAFDHGAFDRLLRAHVTEDGLVDYNAFAASPGFRTYLQALAQAEVEGSPENEQLAFWINAYNAHTIELINRHSERTSIRNINKTLGLFGGKGPWRERMARVAGETHTLDEIEHEILRKRFHEPRIHFALVCAALGCPPLRREAYTGERVEEQLQDQARRFLTTEPAKNRVDVATGTAHLSPIFDWYRDDFPAGDAALGRYLATFLPSGEPHTVLEGGTFKVKYTPYDWSLNIVR